MGRQHSRTWFFVLSLFFLSACAERDTPAPVEELHWQPFNPHQKQYTVQHSDTLYAIAFRFDKDYRELARVNGLHAPYTLHEGQVIAIQSTAMTTAKKKIIKPVKNKVYQLAHRLIRSPKTAKPQHAVKINQDHWQWPVKGKVVTQYNPQKRSKGVNIAGYPGAPVRAARSGVVAYAGNGLSGYGNLIIIKHNEKYLSAYAYNKNIKVKEGQNIKAGQIIADMGRVERKYWGLHFEIRKAGKPVNPMNYLKKKA